MVELVNVMAYMSDDLIPSQEIIFEWKENGVYHECALRKNYDSDYKWKAPPLYDKELIEDLFNQFLDNIEIDEMR